MTEGSPTWHFLETNASRTQSLADALNISPITAQVLVNRGIATTEAAEKFLHPRLADLHDPYLLPDMSPAIDRIVAALEAHEPITIYGDYDVDGTVATSLLLRYLRALDASINFYLPDRNREGYGLNTAALDTIAERGTRLLITVDNGSTATEALAHAHTLGLDVIVTDHHEIAAAPTNVVATINPKRADSTYPESTLCGAGVAFKLLTALRQRLRTHPHLAERANVNLKQFLDLVALATIADIVPLQGENRIFVHIGLAQMSSTTNVGLDALLRVSGTDRARIDSYVVGFQLAPRINAAGRLDHANLAVELLTTSDADQATTLANRLNQLNAERQATEARILTAVDERLRADPLAASRSSIVLADPEWPVGVIGIVASRIAEQYRLPTILIGMGHTIGRGSGRTIGDFPLYEAVSACHASLMASGGHQNAIGVTIRPEQLAQFRERFDAEAKERLTPQHRQRRIIIDGAIAPEQMTYGLVEELQQLEPHGLGNRTPLFCLRHMRVGARHIVGKKHLKMRLAHRSTSLEAIGFSLAEHPAQSAASVDVICTPTFNTWNGLTRLQLKIKDLQPASE